jgi:hypothetical protein
MKYEELLEEATKRLVLVDMYRFQYLVVQGLEKHIFS